MIVASLKAPPEVHVRLEARSKSIEEMVDACARRELPFDELCARIHAMGYKTDSFYYMVIAAEEQINAKP